MPKNDESQEETTEGEEYVNRQDARKENQNERFLDKLVEVDSIECSRKKVLIAMSNNNPHHRYSSDSIPYVQILIIPHPKIFHIWRNIEAFQPPVLQFLFEPSDSGNKKKSCN